MKQQHKKQLKKIKAVLFDVDGIMTDGSLVWNGDFWARKFHIRDGYGIMMLSEAGYTLGIMSGSSTPDITKRAEVLKIPHVYIGNIKKEESFAKFLKDTGLKADQCLYMADDLFDIPVLKDVGFSATVPETVAPVKKVVDYITKNNGGNGAVREVCDMLLSVGSKAKA